MALSIADHHIPPEEYLQGELASEIRHEYVAGRVYAMSGGTLNHQRVAGMAGTSGGKPSPGRMRCSNCPKWVSPSRSPSFTGMWDDGSELNRKKSKVRVCLSHSICPL